MENRRAIVLLLGSESYHPTIISVPEAFDFDAWYERFVTSKVEWGNARQDQDLQEVIAGALAEPGVIEIGYGEQHDLVVSRFESMFIEEEWTYGEQFEFWERETRRNCVS